MYSVAKRAGAKAFAKKVNNKIKRRRRKTIVDIVTLSRDIKQRLYDWEYMCTNEDLICKHITHTTWKSFCSHGDRNRATDRLILKWVRNNGTPLDVQAMELYSDTGIEFNPGQLAEFIIDNDGGHSDYPYHKQTTELQSIFKDLTGFNWTYRIHEILESGFSYHLI